MLPFNLFQNAIYFEKSAAMSITLVLYVKDEICIAIAGAADSVILFCDTRNLKTQVAEKCSHDHKTRKWTRTHGISSLSQDLNGQYISASCMDSRIYLYDVFRPQMGPIKRFSGCDISTFFVKATLSPDAGHILSGSCDGNAYVWQVDKPEADPIVLEGHELEATAVDWCTAETGKIATTSDDYMVRLWNINSSCYSNTRSLSFIPRRVIALPKMSQKPPYSEEANESVEVDPTSMVEMRTSESLRNPLQFFSLKTMVQSPRPFVMKSGLSAWLLMNIYAMIMFYYLLMRLILV